VPLLQVRAGASDTALGLWLTAQAMVGAPSSSPLWRLFCNAAHNARLRACSVVDRLADEAQRLPPDEVIASMTFQLVRRMVVLDLRRRGLGPAFQLRLVLSRAPGRTTWRSDRVASDRVDSDGADAADSGDDLLLLCAAPDVIGSDSLDLPRAVAP
jgi:hypothetical protein